MSHNKAYLEPGVYLLTDDRKDDKKAGVVKFFGFQTQYITMGLEDREQLEFLILPETAQDKRVRWTVDKDGINVDEFGMVTANKTGLYVLKGETVDGGHNDSVIINIVREIAKTDKSGVDFCSVK